MTDSEIKKALECCKYSIYEKRCVDCLLFDEARCIEYVTKDALDLINRKEAEVKHLDIESDALRADLENINRICDEKIAENESLKAEIERLKGHQKDGFFNLLGNCLVFSKTLKDYNDMRKGLKSEAYKEFAEEIENINLSNSDDYFEFKRSRFDNLLNELVGDE